MDPISCIGKLFGEDLYEEADLREKLLGEEDENNSINVSKSQSPKLNEPSHSPSSRKIEMASKNEEPEKIKDQKIKGHESGFHQTSSP